MEWVTVCRADEIGHLDREVFGIGNKWIAVFNVDNRYYAVADLCTHDGGPLAEGELKGHEVICPRHGARFDIRDGKALTIGVAPIDVPIYPTRVQDGVLQIRID